MHRANLRDLFHSPPQEPTLMLDMKYGDFASWLDISLPWRDGCWLPVPASRLSRLAHDKFDASLELSLAPHRRWSSTSWFSGGADTPAWPGLQHSSGRDDANAAAAAGANAGDAEVARVGGAGAQNRFAGNTAVPVGTTPAKDSNCLETTGWAAGMTAHGPPVGGAVAHSRFNDRKRGKGHTCDGTAPPLSRPTGHQVRGLTAG